MNFEPIHKQSTPTPLPAPKPAILLGLPTRGAICTETFNALQAHHDGFRMAPITSARMPVVEARNLIAAKMLEASKTCPWPQKPSEWFCVWVDSDAWWGPKTIAQAVAILTARPEIDLLAASFCTRVPFAPRMAWQSANDSESYPKPGIDCEMRSLVEIEVCAFHFVLHRVDLLERVGPNPFEPDGLCGEDIAFCRRVRSNGGRIFCAPGLIVAHVDPNDGAAYVPGDAALRVEGNRLVRIGMTHLVPKEPELRKYGIAAMDATA